MDQKNSEQHSLTSQKEDKKKQFQEAIRRGLPKGGPKEREQARQKVISPYRAISPDLQERFNRASSWGEIVALHNEVHSSYDTTLISAFLRLYHQDAIQLKEMGKLRSSHEFMLELP